MRPSSNQSANTLFARQLLIAICLFLPPCLFIHENEHIWIAKLSKSSGRPTIKDATILVKGFSAPSSYFKQRVALCISGHFRSFHKPSVHISIKRNIVDVLKEAGYSVDVFFHVGKKDKPRSRTRSSASPVSRHVLNYFNPVSISYFKNNDNGCHMTNCATSSRKATCPYALVRTEECLEHVKKHELRSGFTYDWIYKTRPDIAFGSRLSVPDELDERYLYTNQHNPGTSAHAHRWLRQKFGEKAKILGSPVGDQVLVASRKVAQKAFQASKAFADCNLYDLPNGTLNAEVGLTYWLVRNDIQYRTLAWFWILVRDFEGPECERLVYIKEETQDLMEKCMQYKRSGHIPE